MGQAKNKYERGHGKANRKVWGAINIDPNGVTWNIWETIQSRSDIWIMVRYAYLRTYIWNHKDRSLNHQTPSSGQDYWVGRKTSVQNEHSQFPRVWHERNFYLGTTTEYYLHPRG